MCAICGIIHQNKAAERDVLKAMAGVMSYRGPEEEGLLFKENAGLGHRRLKVIDLESGSQPMANEDETVFLVCNGEIYNFMELRRYLEKRGHCFRSNSDSEVILHFYEEKGEECVNYLRGMFSFAVWDSRCGRLMLARDRLGKKPLLYHVSGDGSIIFASELKALLLYPCIRKEIDPESLDLFLTYQAVPAPRTIFRGIKKLPPACCMIWHKGEVKIERYWNVDFSKKILLKTEEEYSELLWDTLTEATKIRMVSDVPIGAFLSGGLDSSTIVGIMSGMSPGRVKTFSAGFEVEGFDELGYARIAAERFSTDHHEFIVKPDIADVLPKLVWHYNEPFGDSSMVPSYYIARETKRHVTVALNGDGGDESLAGYTRYWQTLLMSRILEKMRKMPRAGRRAAFSVMLKGYERYNKNSFFRLWKWLEEAEKDGYDYAYSRRLTSFWKGYRKELYSEEMKDRLGDFNSLSLVSRQWEEAGDIDLLEKMLYTDQHLYLPEVLMVKMDIASMANSLEARSPFLDHKFVETLASFPSHFKFRRLSSKYLLKKRLRGFLPDEILKRNKMGFGLPLDVWFKGELKDYLSSFLLSDRFAGRGFFNPENVRRMLDEHCSGRALHTSRLWNILIFELWYRIFMEGER